MLPQQGQEIGLSDLLNQVVWVLSCKCGCDGGGDGDGGGDEPTPQDPGDGSPQPGEDAYDIRCTEPQSARCRRDGKLEDDWMGFFDWAQVWLETYIRQADPQDLGLGRRVFEIVNSTTLAAAILQRVAVPGSQLARVYVAFRMRAEVLNSAFEKHPALTNSLARMMQAARPTLTVFWRDAYERKNTTPVSEVVTSNVVLEYSAFVDLLQSSSVPALRSLGNRMSGLFRSVRGATVVEALQLMGTVASAQSGQAGAIDRIP